MNECSKKPCDTNAVCKDTYGSFKCTCNPGYRGNGTHCAGKCKLIYYLQVNVLAYSFVLHIYSRSGK